MSCVYILYSTSKGKFYIGSSRQNNAADRLHAHNAGRTRSTKSGRPWELVYEKEYSDYTEARSRENFLKSGQGRQWIKERLN